MKSNKHTKRPRKGTQTGEAIAPLSHNPTAPAAGTPETATALAPAHFVAKLTTEFDAAPASAGTPDPVTVTLVLDREGRRACMLTALRLGLVLTEYSSARSRLVGLYATVADARSVIHEIGKAAAEASL